MIRSATIEEARTIADLQLRTALYAYKEIFPPEAPPPTVEQLAARWSKDLKDERSRGFVWDADGEIVGVVLSGPDRADERIGHLSRLYVDPEHWSRGIGRALYDVCLTHLDARGFAEATLWVLERNAKAREWYERLGWTLVSDRRIVWAPGGIVDVSYRRSLPA